MEVRLRRRGKCQHFLARQRSGTLPRLKACMEVRLRRRGKRRHFLTRQRSGNIPRLRAPSTSNRFDSRLLRRDHTRRMESLPRCLAKKRVVAIQGGYGRLLHGVRSGWVYRSQYSACSGESARRHTNFGVTQHCTESQSSNATGGRYPFLSARSIPGRAITLTARRPMTRGHLLGLCGRCSESSVRIRPAGICCHGLRRWRESILFSTCMSTGPINCGTTSTSNSVIPNDCCYSRSINRERHEDTPVRSLRSFNEPLGR